MNAVSFIVAFLFCLIIGAISGIAVTYIDIALILTGIAVGDFFGTLLQIGIKLFHSLDKAVILLVSVTFVGVFGYQIINNLVKGPVQQEVSDGVTEILDTLSGFADWAIIAMPIVIVASVVLGFFVNVLLYKRREK